VLGPGVRVFTVTAGSQTCTTTLTVSPCRVLLRKASTVTLPTLPSAAVGARCAAPVRLGDLVDPATLGVSAESVRVRKTSGSWGATTPVTAPLSLTAGSYLVRAVYPGGLTASSTQSVRVIVADQAPPTLTVKASAALPDGSLCVYARRSTAVNACLSVSSAVTASDSCSSASYVTKRFDACAGCAIGTATTQTRACVPLGTTAVVRTKAVDRAGNSAALDVAVAAYRNRASVPAGLRCLAG